MMSVKRTRPRVEAADTGDEARMTLVSLMGDSVCMRRRALSSFTLESEAGVVRRDCGDRVGDLRQRTRRVELVRARRAQARLDVADVLQHQLALLVRLAVVVRG